MKELRIQRSGCVCYARAKLPSIVPNLETLHIFSHDEVVNTPMLPTKFVYLKHLSIQIPRVTSGLSYDYIFFSGIFLGRVSLLADFVLTYTSVSSGRRYAA